MYFFSKNAIEKAFVTPIKAEEFLKERENFNNDIGFYKSFERPQFSTRLNFTPLFITSVAIDQKALENMFFEIRNKKLAVKSDIENLVLPVKMDLNANYDHLAPLFIDEDLEIKQGFNEELVESDILEFIYNLTKKEYQEIKKENSSLKPKNIVKPKTKRFIYELRKLKKMVSKVKLLKKHNPSLLLDKSGNVLPNQIRLTRQQFHYAHYLKSIKDLDKKLLALDPTVLDEITTEIKTERTNKSNK